ncbi:MAG: leucyl aminopeptidase [bacterium]
MQLHVVDTSLKSINADMVAFFIHQDPHLFQRDIRKVSKLFKLTLAPAQLTDFKGKENETTLVYLNQTKNPQRLLLVGLGKKRTLSIEQYRRTAALAAKTARSNNVKTLALSFPFTSRSAKDILFGMTEAISLSLYKYDKYRTKKDDEKPTLEQVFFIIENAGTLKGCTTVVKQAQTVADATLLARNLANSPGLDLYPETLASAAKESAERCGYKVKILDEREIKELGMGGILGVAQGSVKPPRFIILEYGKPSRRTVVLVGKGITFDSGGISIKPSAGMSEMKMDMSGAAAVIGAFESSAQLKLPVHLIGLIPAVENMPSGSALRPGDILRHYNGKTSEVDNTDAEGRLILADALAYASTFKPALVIDLATLTGACVVALGHHAAGMMGTDEKAMKKLHESGNRTYERVWQLPLYQEYEKQIQSDVADVKNTGGRWAGAITAGWFLKKFIGDYRWIHLDIAGTAMMEENSGYIQKGGSGFGVRLLTDFLRHWK